MIKSKIYDFLHKNLGEYLYGLQEDQLNVAILSGHLNFSNANFKPSKVNELLLSQGLPFHLKAGIIGNLQFKYHLMSMLSNPVEVQIDDLYLVLGPIMNTNQIKGISFATDEYSESSEESFISIDHNENSDSDSDQDHMPEVQLLEEAPKKKGVIERYMERVLINLTLSINNLHIRYEDETYPYDHPFSFGVCIDQVLLKSCKQFFNFKNIFNTDYTSTIPPNVQAVKEGHITNVLFYMNSMSSMMVPTSLWEATYDSEIGIFEAMPAYELRELMTHEAEHLGRVKSHCILEPMNLKCSIVIGESEPKIRYGLILEQFNIRMTSSMIECFRNFFAYFTNAQLWGIAQRYRPIFKIPIYPDDVELTDSQKKKKRKIIRKWFVYAMQFMRIKKKLYQFIRQKRRQMRRLAAYKQKHGIHNQESEVESVISDDTTSNALGTIRSVTKGFSFANLTKPRERITPGVVKGSNLSEMVKRYNQNLRKDQDTESKQSELSARVQHAPQPSNRPVKWYMPAIFEIRIVDANFVLEDEESGTAIEFNVQQSGLDVELRQEANIVRGGATRVQTRLRSKGSSQEVLTSGKLPEVRQEKGSLMGVFGNKEVTIPAEYFAQFAVRYVPDADQFTEGECCNFDCKLSPIRVAMSYNIFQQAFELFENFKIDRLKKENRHMKILDLIENKQKETKTGKKKAKNKTALAVAEFLMDAQKQMQRFIKRQDQYLAPLNFGCNLQYQDIKISMLDDTTRTSIFDISLPAGKMESRKSGPELSVQALGVSLAQHDSLKAIYDFMERFTVLGMQKYEYLKEFHNYVQTM